MLFEFDSRKNKFAELKDGFFKGNMFDDLFDQYKNYKVKNVDLTNPLHQLMCLDFAINDLNLYLILNPHDNEAYELFRIYSNEYERLANEYEKKIQVLDVFHDTNGSYTYSSSPWPWEVKNV